MTIHGIDNCHICGEPMGETACPKCGWFDATLALESAETESDPKNGKNIPETERWKHEMITDSDPKADIDAAVEHIRKNCGTIAKFPDEDLIRNNLEEFRATAKILRKNYVKVSIFIFWLIIALGIGVFIGAQLG